MRNVVSLFLTALLAATPFTQLAGQADQDVLPPAANMRVGSFLPDSTRTVGDTILRVSTLEPNSAAAILLAPGAVSLWDRSDPGPSPTPVPLSGGAKAGLIILGVILLVLGIVVAVCAAQADCPGD